MRTHYLDIVVFITLATAAYQGWRRGFVLELLNIVGLLVGVGAGFVLHDLVAQFLIGQVHLPGWAIKTFAFIITAWVVFRIWKWLAAQASDAFKVAGLGMADQALGSVFGLMKSSLIVAAVFWLAGVLNIAYLQQQLANSYIAADVVTVGNTEFALLSKATPLFVRWYHEASAFAFSLNNTQPNAPNTATTAP
jgi:membrane protein required for colicin V production